MPAMDYSKVAKYYDIYARSDIDVPFFIQQSHGCRNVLELTCGTGRLSIPLLEAGVDLSCLDSSPDMLTVLRNKLNSTGLQAPVYEMDVCNFSIPVQYDLIIFPFNAFAEIQDPQQQISALASIRAHMRAGARFICTLHNPAVRLQQVDGQTFLRGRFSLPSGGELKLSSVENYNPDEGIVYGSQIYEIFAPRGEIEEKFSVDLCFRLHQKDAFEALLLAHGFQICALYGDYSSSGFHPDSSPFMIWITQ